MSRIFPRETPETVRVSQVWSFAGYKRDFQGVRFPEIEVVESSGGVPAHGLWHGPEGDVVIRPGDYIVANPKTGAASASSWYDFIGFYEEVLNAPT